MKVLVIRFSSIGDIVLTSPVVRCLHEQLGAEVHYVTKSVFAELLTANPHIARVHTFSRNISEVVQQLRSERFDLVVDLHRNIRSLSLRRALGVRSVTFSKINFRKMVAVRFKFLGILPQKHIVERFFDALEEVGVHNDRKGLEHYIRESDRMDVNGLLPGGNGPFIALVIGGSYYTKRIPFSKLVEICENAKLPVVVLGGASDAPVAEDLCRIFPRVVSLCGKLSINRSASVVSQASWVITGDTGLMHIAAAYRRRIVSVWGNTIPDFGMSPYMPHHDSKIVEVHHLKCRPCSKLGYAKCPQGHFRCMLDLHFDFVRELH